MNNIYLILSSLRVILVFLPQTGYIHPDEHFQGPEIIYGDILQLKVHKTWEFTTEKPIRNAVCPYFVVGFPALIMDALKVKLWGISSYPYLLLVLPRVVMCCFSFIHDILLYNLCVLMKKDPKTHLMIFASSYVTLVYLTRTFSNSLESLFFSFMIYLICKFLHSKNILQNKSPAISDVRRCMNICFMLGLVLTMGVFNRPTFLCYACFPIAAFVITLFSMKRNAKLFFNYFISFCMGSLSILLSFIAIDSLYYSKAHYLSISNLYRNIVVTPVNFILYNIDTKNLDTHGLHTRWLHLCVNLPLLFSAYGILIIIKFIRSNFFKSPHLDFKTMLLMSFVTPLFLLSMIPHQEPRFLLPLIFPLVLSYNASFCNRYVIKALKKVWYIQNIIAVLFFGFFHQGGIYTSTSHIHSIIQNTTSSVVYYKTYMPPRHLLGLELTRKEVQIYDFAGIDLLTLDSLLENMKTMFRPQVLFVVVPHEVVNPILNLPSIMSDYKFFKRKYIFPHLSMESLPDINKMLDAVNSNSSIVNKLLEIKKAFSIHILIFKSIL